MDTELTRDSSDRAKLRGRLELIIADISAGRIAHVEMSKRSKATYRKGGAVVATQSGVPVQIEFYLYANGRVSVQEALAEDYIGGDLSWRFSDDHGRTSDISDEFHGRINASLAKLKLGEVAKMPRPLRWLYLRRN